MKLWKKNIILVLIVVLLAGCPLFIAKDAEFAGADGQAELVIQEIDKDYTPWFNPILEPASKEIESLGFALQAAIGAGIIGFGFGKLSGKRKGSDS